MSASVASTCPLSARSAISGVDADREAITQTRALTDTEPCKRETDVEESDEVARVTRWRRLLRSLRSLQMRRGVALCCWCCPLGVLSEQDVSDIWTQYAIR